MYIEQRTFPATFILSGAILIHFLCVSSVLNSSILVLFRILCTEKWETCILGQGMISPHSFYLFNFHKLQF